MNGSQLQLYQRYLTNKERQFNETQMEETIDACIKNIKTIDLASELINIQILGPNEIYLKNRKKRRCCKSSNESQYSSRSSGIRFSMTRNDYMRFQNQKLLTKKMAETTLNIKDTINNIKDSLMLKRLQQPIHPYTIAMRCVRRTSQKTKALATDETDTMVQLNTEEEYKLVGISLITAFEKLEEILSYLSYKMYICAVLVFIISFIGTTYDCIIGLFISDNVRSLACNNGALILGFDAIFWIQIVFAMFVLIFIMLSICFKYICGIKELIRNIWLMVLTYGSIIAFVGIINIFNVASCVMMAHDKSNDNILINSGRWFVTLFVSTILILFIFFLGYPMKTLITMTIVLQMMCYSSILICEIILFTFILKDDNNCVKKTQMKVFSKLMISICGLFLIFHLFHTITNNIVSSTCKCINYVMISIKILVTILNGSFAFYSTYILYDECMDLRHQMWPYKALLYTGYLDILSFIILLIYGKIIFGNSLFNDLMQFNGFLWIQQYFWIDWMFLNANPIKNDANNSKTKPVLESIVSGSAQP